MTEPVEFLARGAVPQFRLVAEGEQRFLASGFLSGLRDRDHLFDRKIRLFVCARRMREGAVMADVAAKLRERNENLARIGNVLPVRGIPARRSCSEKRPNIGKMDEFCGFGRREAAIGGEVSQ